MPPRALSKTSRKISALFVEPDGVYSSLPFVDLWDESRDARRYSGPFPVVAHPPCQRWGRFWHGSTRKPHQFKLGDDGGCFKAALKSLRTWGGVLEHPCDSHAWAEFEIPRPERYVGWQRADAALEMWTCYVEQGHYGHMSRKSTWLLTSRVRREKLPDLDWSRGEQRLHPVALAKHGYEKARRIGMTAMVGGKNKTKIRNETPIPFRDILVSIAQSVELDMP